MIESDAPLAWLRGEVRSSPFTDDARREAGFPPRMRQRGEKLPTTHSRPMYDIGRRCHEPRVQDERQTWRIVYRLDPDVVVIAHVFSKKSRETFRAVIDRCKSLPARSDALVRGEEQVVKKDGRAKLERAGWVVGGTQEFLDLSDAEMALVEVRVSLARALRRRRKELQVSQAAFARRVGSSQSRVAKMEAGDPSVTIDLLIRSLITSGSTPEEIGRVIASIGLDPAAV